MRKKKTTSKARAEFVNYSEWVQKYNELMYVGGELAEWCEKYLVGYKRLKAYRPNVRFL